jgi:hypothetical protein
MQRACDDFGLTVASHLLNNSHGGHFNLYSHPSPQSKEQFDDSFHVTCCARRNLVIAHDDPG